MPRRYGPNTYDDASLTAIPLSGTAITLERVYDTLAASDRLLATGSFHLGPQSTLNVILDNDALAKNQNINLFRRLVPDPAVPYGSAMKFLDTDNPDGFGAAQPLLRAFGASFDFSNFVLYSRPRGVTHSADATRSVLWRTQKFWNGEVGTVRYTAPSQAATALQVQAVEPNFDVKVVLPSGAARAFRLSPTSKVRGVATSDVPGQVAFMTGFAGVNLSRAAATVTAIPTLPPGVAAHSLQNGDVIFLSSTDPANFPSGFKTITGNTGTTFTYTEAGPAVAGTAYPAAKLAWNSTDDFVANGWQVGDFASFHNGFLPGMDASNCSYRIAAVGATFFKVLQQNGINVPSDALWHAPVDVNTDLFAFPIDQSTSGTGATPPTATWLVGQANALANSPVVALVAGSGAGTIIQTSVEEAIGGTDPSIQLKEGVGSRRVRNPGRRELHAPDEVRGGWRVPRLGERAVPLGPDHHQERRRLSLRAGHQRDDAGRRRRERRRPRGPRPAFLVHSRVRECHPGHGRDRERRAPSRAGLGEQTSRTSTPACPSRRAPASTPACRRACTSPSTARILNRS
jgi:hypothetical protein